MISDKRFVKAWMECETLGQVAKRLNTSKPAVSAKASSLRKRGVQLPAKSPVQSTYTVDELNALVNQYL